MALRTIVKVGNISNLSDARYCAGMGVQYLGFSLDPDSETYMDHETLKSIEDWVVGPSIVGEFFTSDHNYILDSIQRYDIDTIQISNIDMLNGLSKLKLPVILELDISAFQSLDKLSEIMAVTEDNVTFFLLEISCNSNIQTEEILRLATHYKVMVGYDIEKESVKTWLDNTDVYGISLKGGTEIIPGFKDYDELADILEFLEVE
jgi:phosphoribosylanthranilate isomerase